MLPAPQPTTEQARLAALLEIGRCLSESSDPAELRRSVVARLAACFDDDTLFCSEVDAAGTGRLVLVVEDGRTRAAEATYEVVTDAATAVTGIRLEGAATAPLRQAVDDGNGFGDSDARALVAPIRTDDRLIGELGLLRAGGGATFRDADGELLAFGAGILAAALGQHQRVAATDARRHEAERLEEIGRAITSSLELDDVLERIMDAVLDLTRADSCSVWVRAADNARVLASRGAAAPPAGLVVDVAPQIEEALVSRRESIQIEDVSSDGRLPADVRAQVAGDWPRSAVLVPMICNDAVVGVLSVGHHEIQRYDAEAMRILERLALQGAIAMENARLHAEIRDLSLTDPLTGLPNRRQMELVLAKEFEAARRGRPLAVVLLDLDDFKAYNDEHGHPAGDEALREFGRILLSETRAMNLAARYGGDEFLTILSESTAEGALHLVERIQERVRANPLLRGIGVSAGIAQHAANMESPSDLIEAADDALYRSKDT